MLEILKITDEMADDIGRIGFLSWNSAYKNIIPDDFLKEYTADKRAAAMRNSLLSRSEDFYIFKYNEAPAGFAIIRLRTVVQTILPVKYTLFILTLIIGDLAVPEKPWPFA